MNNEDTRISSEFLTNLMIRLTSLCRIYKKLSQIKTQRFRNDRAHRKMMKILIIWRYLYWNK